LLNKWLFKVQKKWVNKLQLVNHALIFDKSLIVNVLKMGLAIGHKTPIEIAEKGKNNR